MRLLVASHLGPTTVVTLVSVLLAHSITSGANSFWIGLAVFMGQLCVGWTNDLVDLESDRAEGRKGKPLAQGTISTASVSRATYFALSLTISLSLLGPFGLRGGLLHLLGVGCGVSYNFYFKRTLLSPLPYLVAFAALPSAILLSRNLTVPIWLIMAGALFGLAAHFANVVKDIDADIANQINGLPQIVGAKVSLFISGISLIEIAAILGVVTKHDYLIPTSLLSFLGLFALPRRFAFYLVMALAIMDVVVLVTLGGNFSAAHS
jgi:4-hydroxybenzoate polyprenyltransferase